MITSMLPPTVREAGRHSVDVRRPAHISPTGPHAVTTGPARSGLQPPGAVGAARGVVSAGPAPGSHLPQAEAGDIPATQIGAPL